MSAETSSKYNKLHKRVKIAIGRSKNSKENVETLDSKKGVQSDKKAQSRKIKGNDVRSVDDKLYKRDNTGRMSMKSKTKDEGMRTGKEGYKAVIGRDRGFKQEGFEVGIDGDRGFRKRIYADRAKDEKNTFRNNVTMPNRKDISKSGWNKLKDDFVKDKRTTKGPRDSEQFSRSNSPIGRRRSNENESLDRKGRTGLTANSRSVYKVKNFELDGSEYDMPKAGAKRKPDQNKQLHWNQNKGAAESHEKYAKKKIQDKKSSADDSAPIDDRPKKRKRVIRIDPHDITNKRLDDGIATNDNIIEKKEDSEKNKNVEMSMNAQFRAIQPSPSILSFVEENLLGRRREIELRRAGYNTDLSVPLDNIPFSTSSERERMEETVFRNKLTFFAAAKISSSIPPPDLPEIAFAGRSNVGKSSLLNALTRQWGVVRTSDKPGLTQTINFFKLGSKVCLVDLPGYGFAYAKEEVKEAWEELVKEYVSTRVGLKQVCLLIDTKWGMKPRDHELINLMERSQTKYQIVLTKTDTVFPIDVARRAMQIEESLKAKKSAVQPVMMVSSKSGAGIRSLRTMFTKIARFAKL